VISTAYINALVGFAIVSGFIIGTLGLIAFLFLLFAKNYEFHDDYLKIVELTKIRIIPYWEIQYFVHSTSEFGKTSTSIRFPTMKVKLRGSEETLIIKENSFNPKLGMHLHEFLRRRTAPKILLQSEFTL
jgi:hypothetical protein